MCEPQEYDIFITYQMEVSNKDVFKPGTQPRP